MSERLPTASPEWLLEALAGTVKLNSIVIPATVRPHHPTLEAAAEELGIVPVQEASGGEDVLCAPALIEPGATLEGIRTAVERFHRRPFVLLATVPAGPAPLGVAPAAAAAEALLARVSDWLVRADHDHRGAELLAPLERVLCVEELSGRWQASPARGAGVGSERGTLAALWLTAARDRASFEAISAAVTPDESRPDELRRRRDRLGPKLGRSREAERNAALRARETDHHELERLRTALFEERAWVSGQARRLADSTSWRLGHRLVRLGRLMMFKRDQGTNLPELIARRVEDRDLP